MVAYEFYRGNAETRKVRSFGQDLQDEQDRGRLGPLLISAGPAQGAVTRCLRYRLEKRG